MIQLTSFEKSHIHFCLVWFDSRKCVIRITLPKSQDFNGYFRFYFCHDLSYSIIWFLFNKTWLIDLEHNDHTQMQTFWIMHAKNTNPKLIHKNVQLKKKIKYKTNKKIKLKGQITKSHRKSSIDVSKMRNFNLHIFYNWRAFI